MAELLEFDRSGFREHFAKSPFEVRHRLHEHPLFRMEAVAELANKMPAHYTGRIAGQLPVAWGEPDRIPRAVDAQPGEVLHQAQADGLEDVGGVFLSRLGPSTVRKPALSARVRPLLPGYPLWRAARCGRSRRH